MTFRQTKFDLVNNYTDRLIIQKMLKGYRNEKEGIPNTVLMFNNLIEFLDQANNFFQFLLK